MRTQFRMNTCLFFVVLALCATPSVVSAQPAGLTGPDYFANMQLKDGADVLPPGAGTFTKKIQVDSGAKGTALDRANAKALGLLKADDTDNGFAEGEVKIGTAVAGAPEPTAHFSKTLTLSAKGKKADGTDKDAAFKEGANKRVIYPKKGEADLSSLLGTNFLSNLEATRATLDPDGTASFFDAPPPVVPQKKVKLILETITPEESAAGLDPRRIIEDIELNAVSADFFVVTGSPFTIVSQALATSLGLAPTGSFDVFDQRPDVFQHLTTDGFFDTFDPGSFDILSIGSFAIPSEAPGVDILFQNVPVLVNPFDTTVNIFGTNVLHLDGLPTVVDYINNQIHYGVPEPATVLLLGSGLAGLGGAVWRRHRRRTS